MDKFVLVFLEEILIYSMNEEEHEEHLRLTLQFLREHQLYEKLSKCDLYRDRIHYLEVLRRGMRDINWKKMDLLLIKEEFIFQM